MKPIHETRGYSDRASYLRASYLRAVDRMRELQRVPGWLRKGTQAYRNERRMLKLVDALEMVLKQEVRAKS